MKKFLLFLGVMSLVFAYEEVKLSDEEAAKLGIKVVVVGEGVSTKGIPFNAFVDFDSKTSITQSSTFDAIVVALHKREGERVKKGEVIAEISSNELNDLFFEFENTQNRYNIAKEIEQKDERLFKLGVISQREYQVSYLSANELQLKLRQIQSTFDLFGIDTKAPKGKHGFRIVAKENGVLAVSPKQTGEKILAFSPYIRIVDGLDLMARIRVPLNMTNYVKPAANVYDNKGNLIGSIKSVSVVIDKDTNTVLATANLKQTHFKVGETIEVYIDGNLPKDSVVVPVEAIIKNDGDYLVFKKVNGGFLPTKIKILEEKNKAFIVNTYEKIKVGDKIAVGSIIALKGIINDIGD